MKYSYKRILSLFFGLILVFTWLPISARADTGPKPSVRISFENLGDSLCYGTLLSEKPSTGPQSAWDGSEDFAYHNDNEHYPYATLNYETWKAFVDYEDTDGYYFLQIGWQVNETKELNWTYYPPQKFKILLYFPETDTFLVSGIYERYAFDSYFSVDVGADMLQVEKSYQFGWEILSLLARICITIALEMAIALLFGFRDKKTLLLLIIVNSATQIILNVLLNIINFNSGQAAFVTGYILLEIAIFAIEAVVYCLWLEKLTPRNKNKLFYVLYALIANGFSFIAGLEIAKLIPGIF